MTFSSKTVAIVGLEPLQAEKIRNMLTADVGLDNRNIRIFTDVPAFNAFVVDAHDWHFDAILAGLCGCSQNVACRLVSVAPGAAIILCLETADRVLEIAALGAGAQDVMALNSLNGMDLGKSLMHGIERARTRSELRSKNSQLVRLNEEKNRFVAMAAHDLRGPIGLIGSLADLVLSDAGEQLDGANRETLDMIRSSADRMVRLIEELLDTVKIESGLQPLRLSKVGLASFVTDCVRHSTLLARRKGITIETVCPDNATIEIDVERLAQVMENLISNALKYSSPGTPVRVEALVVDKAIEIRVQDRGPGIPETEIEKIFGAFYRGSTRPTAGEPSTGLGLSIVKGIVAEHQGEVGVISKVGNGSTFWFRVPRQASVAPHADGNRATLPATPQVEGFYQGFIQA